MGSRFGQVPVGNPVFECLPGVEPRAERGRCLGAQREDLMHGDGGIRFSEGVSPPGTQELCRRGSSCRHSLRGLRVASANRRSQPCRVRQPSSRQLPSRLRWPGNQSQDQRQSPQFPRGWFRGQGAWSAPRWASFAADSGCDTLTASSWQALAADLPPGRCADHPPRRGVPGAGCGAGTGTRRTAVVHGVRPAGCLTRTTSSLPVGQTTVRLRGAGQRDGRPRHGRPLGRRVRACARPLRPRFSVAIREASGLTRHVPGVSARTPSLGPAELLDRCR